MITLPTTPQMLLIGGGATIAFAAYKGFPKNKDVRQVVAVAAAGAVAFGALSYYRDVRLGRHPELMNGFFHTGGRASAVTGKPADVAAVRAAMGAAG